MVKGLAKFGNRLRHDRMAKYVDASPFWIEGRLLPNDAAMIPKSIAGKPAIVVKSNLVQRLTI